MTPNIISVVPSASDAKAAIRALVLPPEKLTWPEKVEVVMKELGKLPQLECPLKHYFAPGVYIREITMPEGAIIIGKIHKTEHFNIIQSGAVSLIHEDHTEFLEAPLTFVSKGGVQKVLYIHKETVWSTVHVTEERDLDRLEALLIEPSESYPSIARIQERIGIMLAAKEETRQ